MSVLISKMVREKLIFRLVVLYWLSIETGCDAMVANVTYTPSVAGSSVPFVRREIETLSNNYRESLNGLLNKVPLLRVKHRFMEQCLSSFSSEDYLIDDFNKAAIHERKDLALKLADKLERTGAFLSQLYELKQMKARQGSWINLIKGLSSKLFEYILEGSFSLTDDERDLHSLQTLESLLSTITEQLPERSHEEVQKLLVKHLVFFDVLEEFLENCRKTKTVIVEAINEDEDNSRTVLPTIAAPEVSSIIRAIFDFLSSRMRRESEYIDKTLGLSFVLRDFAENGSRERLSKKSLEQAIKDSEWLRSFPEKEAAQTSYVRDCNEDVYLGEFYYLGKFMQKDQIRAVVYFSRAADRIVPFPEQPRAWARLGEQYLLGKGTKKDQGKGLKYLNMAADQKNNDIARSSAHITLGEAYLFGDGVKLDYITALSYFNQVVAQNESKALEAVAHSRLAGMYWWGMGVEKDLIKARIHYEKVDIFEAPVDYESGTYQKAEAWQRLGDIYLQGQGVAVNHKKANAYFRKAMQQNINREARAHGWLRMGEAYLFGNGVASNGEKAFELLNKAVSQGDSREIKVWAHLALGTYYYRFKGAMAKATTIFKKIAMQTDVPEAQKTAQEFLKSLF